MKNTFTNPLKTFNDNKALAIKKMGGAQVAFKKSLRKAQFGEETNDELINKPGSTGGYKAPMKKQYPWGAPVELNTPKSNYLNPSYAKDNIRIVNEKMFNDTIKNYSTNPQTGKVNYTGPKSIPIDKQKKGGVIKSLRKAQTGETGAPETVAAPVEDKPKVKDYVNMSKKDFRAEKQGAKRAKKLEDIASGANRERADKILNTVGNIASTAANVTNVVSDIKNRKNSNNGEPPFQKGGTAKEKAQAAVDRARMQYNRDFAAMKRKRGVVPPPTPISKSIQIPSYSKYKSGGATKALPKAQLGGVLNNIATLKKIYNMYNTAKQSSKLGKLPAAKKVKKSGVTKVMSKSFNAIKNKKK